MTCLFEEYIHVEALILNLALNYSNKQKSPNKEIVWAFFGNYLT